MSPKITYRMLTLHHIEPRLDTYMDLGSGQFIWRLGDPGSDGYVAASDSRRDGLAAGF